MIDEEAAVEILCKSNKILFLTLQVVSLALNMCLCIDVVYAIYKPFAPSASRVNSYYIFTIAMGIASVAWNIYYVNNGQAKNPNGPING